MVLPADFAKLSHCAVSGPVSLYVFLTGVFLLGADLVVSAPSGCPPCRLWFFMVFVPSRDVRRSIAVFLTQRLRTSSFTGFCENKQHLNWQRGQNFFFGIYRFYPFVLRSYVIGLYKYFGIAVFPRTWTWETTAPQGRNRKTPVPCSDILAWKYSHKLTQ